MNKIGETEKALKMRHDIITGGQKIIGPDERFLTDLPAVIKDSIWARFRISNYLSQGMPSARLIAAATVLPESKQALQSETQNALVRVMSILDEELVEYVDQNDISTDKNPKLFHRLNAVHDVCTLPNISELHSIREIRNNISHELNPQELSWSIVNNAADEVEKALIYLGILTFTTNFTVGDTENSAVSESKVEGEKYRRTLTLKINQNNILFCEYSWLYVFY